jgi:hypothetical protein
MKIRRLQINGYKNVRNCDINFSRQASVPYC